MWQQSSYLTTPITMSSNNNIQFKNPRLNEISSDKQIAELEREALIAEFIAYLMNRRSTDPVYQNQFDTYFDTYKPLIDRLINKTELDIHGKRIFIELIDYVADAIWTTDNYADKYGTTHHQQTKIYDEPELNLCSKLLNNLDSELIYDLENAYDIAYEKSG